MPDWRSIHAPRVAAYVAALLVVGSVVIATSVASSHHVPRVTLFHVGRRAGSQNRGVPLCVDQPPASLRRCMIRRALSLRPPTVHASAKARSTSSDQATQWQDYASSVNPGSAIQFVSASSGWRVDGIYAAPWLDDELATGPAGTTLDWPGGSISKSTDGGATWTVMRSDPNGIWGLDFLSEDLGWVVGVTSLAGTTDGGSTWTVLGEPSGSSLVRVQFTSPMAGLGLTTSGQLVQTTDGGATWQSAALSIAGTSLCTADDGTAYVSNAEGDVFEAADGASTWSQTYQTTLPSVYSQVWSGLECDADSAWQGIRIVSPLLHHEAYLVEHSDGAGSAWSPVMSNQADGPSLVESAPSTDGIATLGGIATYQGKALIVGLPSTGFAAVIAAATPSAPSAPSATTVTASPAVAPALPASSSLNGLTTDPADFVRILGVSSIGANAWVYLVDAATNGVSPTYHTLVLSTTDGGSSWATQNDSGPLQQPQYP
jgi:hypothetical protein